MRSLLLICSITALLIAACETARLKPAHDAVTSDYWDQDYWEAGFFDDSIYGSEGWFDAGL